MLDRAVVSVLAAASLCLAASKPSPDAPEPAPTTTLQAVRGMANEVDVRQALLDALQRDSNPGVRVAAMNALAGHTDEDVQAVLERLAAEDPNGYVRLKSARAVHRLVEDETWPQ